MKGVGSYNDWTYYASPSSNLSAFAEPFSVNRPNPNDASAPFVDSSQSLDGAVPQIQYPQSHAYDFFLNPKRELDSIQFGRPSSVAQLLNFDSMASPSQPKDAFFLNPKSELDSTQFARPPVPQLLNFNSMGLPPNPKDAFSYDQSSYGTKPSPVKARPYYPSYGLSPIGDPTPSVVATSYCSSPGFASLDGSSLGDYANKSPELAFPGQRGGLWNQTPEFNNGKSKQTADIIGLGGEERTNQGCQDLNGEVLLLPFGWQKNRVPINADQLEDKPCWMETVKPMPVEFSAASFMGSPSVPLETYLAANSGSEKPSGVDTVASTPITELVMDLNIGNTVADGDRGKNNFYNMKQAYHMPNTGTIGGFDLSYLRMHLERDEHSSSNNAMISDKNVSGHIVHDIFKERHGFQNPHAGLDNLSLRLSAIGDVNSVEKSFEGGDRCNPAVDSPCWKGAPAAHFSLHEASVALPPEYVHKKEECFGSAIQEPHNFLLDNNNNVKYLCGNSNSYHYQETGIVGSPMKCSETKVASEYCNSDVAVNAGSFQSESSHDCGLQYLDDTTETKENSVALTMPTYACESGSSHALHQVIEENSLMFQKQHTLCFGRADAGSNANECVEHSAPYPAEYTLFNRSVALDAPKTGGADAGCDENKCMATPYPPEDDQFKRSFTVDAPNTLQESAGKVSTQKLSVQMLVDTMHNLSELLLFHCLNDACELKERDRNILKNVINNLNTCALNNAEQFTSAQECLSPKPETFRGAGESCHLQQNSSFEKPQSTKVEPEISKVGLENPLVQEAKNLHFRSEKPHWQLSDSLSSRDKAEMTKDKMTKALKKILSENFHDDEEANSQTVLYKNLWLEAEAALCSVSYRARYNQMKIEMENHSHKQKDMEEQSNPEAVPSLSENQSSATKVPIDPNLYSSVVPDALAFNATFLNHHRSGLQFSAEMNKPNELTPEGKDTQDLDSSIHDSTVSCTQKEVEDDEASVIARFRVLKARADKSCINTTNPEEPSDIAADKLSPRQKNNKNQINFYQDSSIPGKNKADYEASVMTRFHILKSRIEDPSSVSSERKLLDDGTKDDASEGKSFDVHVNPSGAHLISYIDVDKSIPKEEFLMDSPQEIQLWMTCEDDNQLPTHYSDGLASDWEHVEKRSL